MVVKYTILASGFDSVWSLSIDIILQDLVYRANVYFRGLNHYHTEASPILPVQSNVNPVRLIRPCLFPTDSIEPGVKTKLDIQVPRRLHEGMDTRAARLRLIGASKLGGKGDGTSPNGA